MDTDTGAQTTRDKTIDYLTSALLILGLWTAVTTLVDLTGFNLVPKTGSVGESAIYLFRNEFIFAAFFLVLLILFIALLDGVIKIL